MKLAPIAALALFTTFANAAEPLPVGKSKVSLTVRDETFDVFTYRPKTYQNGPLLVVMHGLSRNADGYRDHATVLANEMKALVIAPHFPVDRFPTETYQRGAIVRKNQAQPQNKWTFQYVAELLDLVRQNEGRPDMPYFFIGHSAGGQFLNRMAAFLPGKAQRIVAANPGSLLFPSRDHEYPFGFGGLPNELGGDDQIKAYLAAPLTLYLGTADLLDKDLDQSPEANRQGKTRFERGHVCFDTAQALAKERGWPFNWQLVEAPDIGHTAKGMFTHPQALKTFSKP